MNRTLLFANCRRTESTTSTTGPQVLLEQNLGVANTRTKGLCAARELATEYCSSARSGGIRVVRLAVVPQVLCKVGVLDA